MKNKILQIYNALLNFLLEKLKSIYGQDKYELARKYIEKLNKLEEKIMFYEDTHVHYKASILKKSNKKMETHIKHVFYSEKTLNELVHERNACKLVLEKITLDLENDEMWMLKLNTLITFVILGTSVIFFVLTILIYFLTQIF